MGLKTFLIVDFISQITLIIIVFSVIKSYKDLFRETLEFVDSLLFDLKQANEEIKNLEKKLENKK